VFLDQESKGYVTYTQFCTGCKQIGFVDDLYNIWCALLGVENMTTARYPGSPANTLKSPRSASVSHPNFMRRPPSPEHVSFSPRSANSPRVAGSSISGKRLQEHAHISGRGHDESTLSSKDSTSAMTVPKNVSEVLRRQKTMVKQVKRMANFEPPSDEIDTR